MSLHVRVLLFTFIYESVTYLHRWVDTVVSFVIFIHELITCCSSNLFAPRCESFCFPHQNRKFTPQLSCSALYRIHLSPPVESVNPCRLLQSQSFVPPVESSSPVGPILFPVLIIPRDEIIMPCPLLVISNKVSFPPSHACRMHIISIPWHLRDKNWVCCVFKYLQSRRYKDFHLYISGWKTLE